MLKLIGKWWRKRQRKIDLQILWPECIRQSNNIQDARNAFKLHCLYDDAWMQDYDLIELESFIDALPR